MKYARLLLLMISICPRALYAQTDCDSIGFETGNTNAWTLTNGSVRIQNQKKDFFNEIPSVTNQDHYVTSIKDGNDLIVPSISMVAPGSTHSIRIGNTRNGQRFERIRARFTVTPGNSLFQYKLAVVLQNPTLANGGVRQHTLNEKPGFSISFTDKQGQILPCSDYDVKPEDNSPNDGFTLTDKLQYRNWTNGSIDLKKYIGEEIFITVTVHGCLIGTHYGYAYFDAECLKTPENLEISSDCPDTQGYSYLTAPGGFGKYVWSNGDSTQKIRVKAALGEQYGVNMLPAKSLTESCGVRLAYTIKHQQIRKDIDTTICQGEQITLGDTVIKTPGTYTKLLSGGNFCDSIVVLKLGVISPVTLQGVTPDTYISKGDSTEIRVVPYPAGDYQFLWSNPESLSCPDCAITWARPGEDTEYEVTVTDSKNSCPQKAKVRVYVRPCRLSIPSAFSPDHDQLNEVFFVYSLGCIDRIKEMIIYNRQGEVVFRQENFAPSDPKFGWNGVYHGLPAAPGTYPYKIQAATIKGEILNYQGVVNLLR